MLDARDLYDAVAKNESAACGMNDCRSAIEALALKQALLWGGTRLRWVHSQAQLADVLTRTSTGLIGRMLHFLSDGRWRLVDDPMFTSARKRAAAGIEVLGDVPHDKAPSPPSTSTPSRESMTLFGLLEATAVLTLWGYIWSR